MSDQMTIDVSLNEKKKKKKRHIQQISNTILTNVFLPKKIKY